MDQSAPTFTGVYAASLTPLRDDLSCDSKELAAHCADLIDRGCRGVLLFGTTGEGPSFTAHERQEILRSVIKQGVDPRKILVGISCSAICDAVQLASAAVELHCGAVLIVPPFFYKHVEDRGVIAFYREVIQRVSHPNLKVILYHIPQHSGVPITLPIIKTLREEFPDTVIGIKESEGNIALTKEIVSECPGFKVFAGKELHISEAARSGAAGAITGMANVYPELICSLYQFGKDAKKPDNNETARNISKIVQQYPVLPAIKALVQRQKGAAWDIMRPPLLQLDDQQKRTLFAGIDLLRITL